MKNNNPQSYFELLSTLEQLDYIDCTSSDLYELFLDYKDIPIDRFLEENDPTDDGSYTEEEFLDDFVDKLNWIIRHTESIKRFLKKRRKDLSN